MEPPNLWRMVARSYTLLMPEHQSTSVVFASPHSGRDYPPDMTTQTRLTAAQIRSSEDAYVDDLIRDSVHLGAPVLLAQAARAYVDLNRDETELDSALIEGIPKNRANPRVASGLGVVPRVVAQGRAIYHGKLTMVEAERRLDIYWRPYHNRLERLLQDTAGHFGHAILFDMHSMPRESLRHMVPRPHVVLGDHHGKSAAPSITDRVESIFTDAGFTVSRNAPFAGAYIARRYGNPDAGRHCIQIEMDRSLYLGATETPQRSPAVAAFRARLGPVLARLALLGVPSSGRQPLDHAAE